MYGANEYQVICLLSKSRIEFSDKISFVYIYSITITSILLQYLALSNVAECDFPIAPNPTPTASPSNKTKKSSTIYLYFTTDKPQFY